MWRSSQKQLDSLKHKESCQSQTGVLIKGPKCPLQTGREKKSLLNTYFIRPVSGMLGHILSQLLDNILIFTDKKEEKKEKSDGRISVTSVRGF